MSKVISKKPNSRATSSAPAKKQRNIVSKGEGVGGFNFEVESVNKKNGDGNFLVYRVFRTFSFEKDGQTVLGKDYSVPEFKLDDWYSTIELASKRATKKSPINYDDVCDAVEEGDEVSPY